MRDRPAGVGEIELRRALTNGWRIHPVSMRYMPVGGGSYHWVVQDGRGGQWFATVDDLDNKSWLGESRAVVATGLRAAMDTAFALRHQAGLQFVAAPVPAVHGETVLPLAPKYTVAIFPLIRGASGRFGAELPEDERAELVDMLVALHRSTPAAVQTSACQIGLPRRGALEMALRELSDPWHGGPFSEPARAVLTGAEERLRRLLNTFDQLAGRVTARATEPVITHGEPHPANIIWTDTGKMLIDWDTVGVAPPERDLWMVVSETGEESRRYTKATGRPVDPAALAMYRIRWALYDISVFTEQLRAPHRRCADTEHTWLSLKRTLASATP